MQKISRVRSEENLIGTVIQKLTRSYKRNGEKISLNKCHCCMTHFLDEEEEQFDMMEGGRKGYLHWEFRKQVM